MTQVTNKFGTHPVKCPDTIKNGAIPQRGNLKCRNWQNNLRTHSANAKCPISTQPIVAAVWDAPRPIFRITQFAPIRKYCVNIFRNVASYRNSCFLAHEFRKQFAKCPILDTTNYIAILQIDVGNISQSVANSRRNPKCPNWQIDFGHFPQHAQSQHNRTCRN